MSVRRLAVSALVAPALLAGCGRSTDATATATGPGDTMGPNETATASLAPANARGAAASATLPLTAQAFVDTAASSDLYEMGAAKLADAGDHPTAVRSFAQMMMRDHAASSAALKTAVSETTGGVQIDAQKLMPEHQAMLNELKSAAPTTFAQVYARQQVAAHEKTLAVLDTYANSGDSKPLMAFAAKTAPIVRAHLEAARKLPQ